MELAFAFVFSCLVQFRSCTYTMNPQPFKDPTACVAQLTLDLDVAERNRPDSIGDLNYPRYAIFGVCGPAFKVRVNL